MTFSKPHLPTHSDSSLGCLTPAQQAPSTMALSLHPRVPARARRDVGAQHSREPPAPCLWGYSGRGEGVWSHTASNNYILCSRSLLETEPIRV